MNAKTLLKKIERLEKESEAMAKLFDALDVSFHLLEKEQRNSQAMAQIPGQQYAKEWGDQAKHQSAQLETLKAHRMELLKQWDKICDEMNATTIQIHQLEKKGGAF